jgi:hypothetical protein
MTRFKPIIEGGRYGICYEFEHHGECIPMHSHADTALHHSTAVVKGYVHVFGPNVSEIVAAGSELAFDSSKDHEIEALQDGTEIINFFSNGKPPLYEGVPSEQLSGTCNFVRSQRAQ